MAILKTKARKKLKAKTFGLPKERKYPMPDKSHAVNAKARARQMKDEGKLSKGKYDEVVRKANKKLYGKASLTDPKKKAKSNEKEYEMKHAGRRIKVKSS